MDSICALPGQSLMSYDLRHHVLIFIDSSSKNIAFATIFSASFRLSSSTDLPQDRLDGPVVHPIDLQFFVSLTVLPVGMFLTWFFLSGGLGVAIEGPSKVQIVPKDNKDGTVTITYTPKLPGEYKIVVKYGGQMIEGAPYFAKIAAPCT